MWLQAIWLQAKMKVMTYGRARTPAPRVRGQEGCPVTMPANYPIKHALPQSAADVLLIRALDLQPYTVASGRRLLTTCVLPFAASQPASMFERLSTRSADFLQAIVEETASRSLQAKEGSPL
jgi:hypothetical protein